MKKIAIMMSTYNGEKYLKDQLNSIFSQTYSNFFLLIRDDGSTDSTRIILEEYKNKYPNKLKIYYEKNKGAKESFMELLSKVSSDFDFYAFADQDDIWLKNKLERGIIKLTEGEGGLYFSNYDIVNTDLSFIRKGYKTIKMNTKLNNSFVQCSALGCTMIFDNNFFNKLKNKNIVYKNIIMHDYWVYLVASCFSNIIIDFESTILYRQHDKNVFGTTTKYSQRFYNLLKRLDKKNSLEKYNRQIYEFKSIYIKELNKNEIRLIEKYLSRKNIFGRILNLLDKTVILNEKSSLFTKITRTIYFIFNRS